MRDYFPTTWRQTILFADIEKLEYFGTENLSLMLEEWQFHQKAIKAAIEAYERGPCPERNGFFKQEFQRSKKAIADISEALKVSQWKPRLITHRDEDFFDIGEYIYIYAQDDDYPQLSGSRYKRVRIYQKEDKLVYAMLHLRGGASLDIGGTIFSPTFLKQSEILYLQRNEDFMDFWIQNITQDEQDQQFIAECIMNTRIRVKSR